MFPLPDAVSHVDVLSRQWVRAGASLWLLAPEGGVGALPREEDRVGQGEIVACRIGDIAVRLWVRLPDARLTHSGGLRVSIKSSGPVLVGEVTPIDLPAVGPTFWARPPLVWIAWERRRAFRVRVHTFCQIWLPATGSKDEPLVRRVIDLSTTGMAIESVPGRVGDEVRLVLELAPVAAPLALAGRIVRQESVAVGADTAIAFVPGDAARGVLLQYLLTVSARHLGSALRRQ